MLARPMIYRHSHHCLSWNIPYPGTQGMFHEDYSYIGLPNPQRILVLHDYSSIGCPISSSKSIRCQIITQSSILSSQVKTRMMCLSLPLRQGGHIPIKECTHSYKRNDPKLPLGLGISKFLLSKKLSRLPLNQGPTTTSQVEMMGQLVA